MSAADRVVVNFEGNERVDLPDFLALRDDILANFKFLIRSYFDGDARRILKRYQEGTHSGLTFKILKDVSRSFHDKDQEFVFMTPSPSGQTINVVLAPSTVNYVQVKVAKNKFNLQARAFWDTDIGLTGEEFFDTINTQLTIEETVETNTTGFTPGAVPLFIVTTDSSSILTVNATVQDHLFKPRAYSLPAVGSRSTTYDPLYDFRSVYDMLMALVAEFKGTSQNAENVPWSTFKLLREYQNIFYTGGGNISFEESVADTLAWDAAIKVEIAGRDAVYTIPAGSVVLEDGECMYVDIPEGVAANLTPVVAALTDVPIDPTEAGSSKKLMVLFFRRGGTIYGTMDMPELDSGEVVVIGQDLPQALRARLGITGENSFQAYTSTQYILAGDNYPSAISKLDAAIDAIATAQNQRNWIIVPDGPGVTVYNDSMLTWDPDTNVYDILVLISGRIKTPTEDYNKTSSTQITFTEVVPPRSRIEIIKIRTGAAPLASANITVRDEGVSTVTNLNEINFVGAGVSVSQTAAGKAQVQINGAGGNQITKSQKNGEVFTILAGQPGAWKDDGTVGLADANISSLSDFAGIAVNNINPGEFGLWYRGGNCPGVLAGLGATVGDKVYLGETPGTFQLTPPPGIGTDTVFKVGKAEPPDGVATALADDLFLEPEFVSGP